jgi:hypothetical protein
MVNGEGDSVVRNSTKLLGKEKKRKRFILMAFAYWI